jgi:hypothetical protein
LAHGETQRTLRGRRSAAAKVAGQSGVSLYDEEQRNVFGRVGFSEAW